MAASPKGKKKMVQKICTNTHRRAIRPIDREKMRPWLIKRLDSGEIKGFEWSDREKEIFQVTWRHASHHQYIPESDCSIFKCWAEHTGKFKPGDKSNAKNWKANFRCALNSLKHEIKELKDKSVTKGGNAVRIYQFLDEKSQAKSPRRCKNRNDISTPSIKKEAISDEDSCTCSSEEYISYPDPLASIRTYSIPNFDEINSGTDDKYFVNTDREEFKMEVNNINKNLIPIPVPNFSLISKENSEERIILEETMDICEEVITESDNHKLELKPIPRPNFLPTENSHDLPEFLENHYFDSLTSEDIGLIEVTCSTSGDNNCKEFLLDEDNNIIMSTFIQDGFSF